MYFCYKHGAQPHLYGGNHQCRECKIYDTEVKSEGCSIFWKKRISKLDMKAGEVMHHNIESKIANLYFDIFGRVNETMTGKKTMSHFIAQTPYSLKTELRLRAELLFCYPMQRKAHTALHRKLIEEGKVNGK